jgi:SAM-dependent methyltransferase
VTTRAAGRIAHRDMADAPATTPKEPAKPVERYEPDRLEGELVEAEHLVRYRWAAGVAGDRDVLDAGCGEGYGCAILAAAGARRVIGVDLAGDVIERARGRYGEEGRVEFSEGDVAALPFEDDSFDLVTCFETIEHVAAQERVIAELARVLRPGGIAICSSPNREEYPPGNPYHVRELVPGELKELLGAAFPEVRLFRQHNWIASAILDDGSFALADASSLLDADVVKLQGRSPGSELYTLAVCSDRPFEAPVQQALLTHGLEVRRWLARIEEARAEGRHSAAAIAAELEQAKEALAARDRELFELRAQRSATMGDLERQAYWLQRADIDPDAWLRHRPLAFAFRALQLARRLWRKLGK